MTYNSTEIFTYSDLKAKIVSRIIKGDIVIRGEHLNKIKGVEKIIGLLGISDSSVESLGELKEITGDFWTSFYNINSPLTSLHNLEKIGGDVSLRYSNISDLGNLYYVGGKLSLRDTKINSLGRLQYVGGDLYLPKRLKDKIDLNCLQVVGKIKFWNDSQNKIEIIDKSNLGLLKSSIPVPYWQHQYIYSVDDLSNANEVQIDFYNYFKKSFFKDEFIDICDNNNYSFILFHELLANFNIDKNIKKLEIDFCKIEKHYPQTSNYTSLSLIEIFEKKEDYRNAWKLMIKREFVSVQSIWEYEQKLNTKLLDGELISRLGGYSHLTNFGQNNIEEIIPFAFEYLKIYEKEMKSPFFELFFDKGNLFKTLDNCEYSAEFYIKYYFKESEYQFYKSIDESQSSIYNPSVIRHVVEKAILNQFRLILNKAEDLYRLQIGMPKIGEGWISETELFYKIKNTFSEYIVVHSAKPIWIGRQHLDIYFPELNIAIEYQGLQHYEPIEFFGGQEAFEKNKERDEIKRKKCIANDCILIYVDENYDLLTLQLEINNIIKKKCNSL